jgi:hypothetical protein
MQQFWLISADMGYGHYRAIYPLHEVAYKGYILNANNMPDSSPKEKRLWSRIRLGYEFLSRATKLPLVGVLFLKLLNNLLYIPSLYPLSDGSSSTYQVRYLRNKIRKGLAHSVTSQIMNPELPLITSFYSVAIAAEMSGHKNIYCIICDTDINRVWVSENPAVSRIIYFVPGSVSEKRLNTYGVPTENIKLTGFPLPIELLGNRSLNTLKENLTRRLIALDPECRFYSIYKPSLNAYLEYDKALLKNPCSNKQPLTITFVVGGAGAQKEIGKQIAISLIRKIKEGEVRLNLVAGTRSDICDYFLQLKNELASGNENINIIWSKETGSYFERFNKCLATTDVLWTKPSELTFYCALGLPIIISPPIGPQEKCNRRWLRETGAGLKQLNLRYTNQWLNDLLINGRLAEAAWLGFLKARKCGTFNILDYLEKGSFIESNDPLKR